MNNNFKMILKDSIYAILFHVLYYLPFYILYTEFDLQEIPFYYCLFVGAALPFALIISELKRAKRGQALFLHENPMFAIMNFLLFIAEFIALKYFPLNIFNNVSSWQAVFTGLFYLVLYFYLLAMFAIIVLFYIIYAITIPIRNKKK